MTSRQPPGKLGALSDGTHHRESIDLDANDLWEAILRLAAKSVTEQGYATWLSKVKAVSWSDGVLHAEATSRFHAEWVEDKYGGLLRKLGEQVVGTPVEIRVTSSESPDRRPPEVSLAPVAHAPPTDRRSNNVPAYLNSRYTFDRFVVGENNRLAQAASLAVAERPAQAYNPLFLYGATGLGKTHLMQAIANRILESKGRPAPRVCYIPTEQFMNEMVTAIQKNTMEAFRARYRSYELLLVDDVQFLRRKEHTQEEFFHTFNALHQSSCQIVLSSDRKPKELEGLQDRLMSRFEWGLVADMTRPSYETRVAILRKKAEEDEVCLAAEILDLIARRCRSSVRELEGAIIQLLAFSSLTSQELTLEMARRALVSAGPGSNSDGVLGSGTADMDSLNPEAIRNLVAEAWGLAGEELASATRARQVLVPRQVAMLLIKELLDVPLRRVGQALGGRHHSTVLHSIRKLKDQLATDRELRSKVESLVENLRRTA